MHVICLPAAELQKISPKYALFCFTLQQNVSKKIHEQLPQSNEKSVKPLIKHALNNSDTYIDYSIEKTTHTQTHSLTLKRFRYKGSNKHPSQWCECESFAYAEDFMSAEHFVDTVSPFFENCHRQWDLILSIAASERFYSPVSIHRRLCGRMPGSLGSSLCMNVDFFWGYRASCSSFFSLFFLLHVFCISRLCPRRRCTTSPSSVNG